MENEFVGYDIAIDLKLLGYNNKNVFGYYDTNTNLIFSNNKNCTIAPLWQQAIDFLISRFNINVEMTNGGKEGLYYVFVKDWVYGDDRNNPKLFTFFDGRKCGIEKAIEIIKNE